MILQDILEAVSLRWATALGLDPDRVYIDRRTGDAGGDAGYVDMEGQGLRIIPGRGTVCHSCYELRLSLSAILADDGSPVYAQRLALLSAASQALCWRSGVGAPIPNVGFPTIEAASVTEPFDPMDATFGIAIVWTGQVFLPDGEAW